MQAVKPVRPPASTPDVLSTKYVTVDVPKKAPPTVPIASDNKAFSTPVKFPSSSTKPARFATPSKVPAVTKKSTNNTEKIAIKVL